MHLRIIATVDERKRSEPLLPLKGELDSLPPSRPTVYVSRELCLRYRLRNATVVLTAPDAGDESLKVYASIKIFAKDSLLFRNDPRFPEKLLHETTTGSEENWDVVVNNVLWWDIQHFQRLPLSTILREDYVMSNEQKPFLVDAQPVGSIVVNYGASFVEMDSKLTTPPGLNICFSLLFSSFRLQNLELLHRYTWISRVYLIILNYDPKDLL